MHDLMEMISAIMIIVTYLLLPIAGIVAYVRLLRKMKREQVPRAPKLTWFALFYIYGGVLTMILTAIFCQWSGMASLGLFFLLFIAPAICGMIAWRHRHNIELSVYHRIARRMALGYLIGEGVLVAVGIFISIVISICNSLAG